MNKQFLLWKKQALEKLDKSFVGGIDEKIESLCNIINKKKNMFTLSSCSGRVCLISKNSEGKEKSCWLYVTHDLADSEELKDKFNELEENRINELRQESAIIHMCVKDLDLATKLMHSGKTCGFNQVGIIALKNKIVVELICDIQYIIPVEKELITEGFIDFFIKKANENMIRSWDSIKKLELEINVKY